MPQKYRAPIVLCYLEGQTYEETARRIGCPVGTVRVRLHRARDRLRDRLARRGYGPGVLSAALPANAGVLPSAWVEATVKSAVAMVSGRALEAGAVSATALALSQGILRSIMFTKLKIAALGLMAAVAVAAGGQAIVGQGPATQADPPAPSTKAGVDADTTLRFDPKPDLERELATRIRDSALKRLEAQKAFYEEGRITIDRYISASQMLRDAEMELATNRKERVEAAEHHFERTETILKREKDDLNAGRGTIADVAEAAQAKEIAELGLVQALRSGGRYDFEAIERRLNAIEQKLERIIKLQSLLTPGDDGARSIKRAR